MYFYLLLTAITSLIGVAALAIWLRTRSFGFMLGIASLYFWSIHGAWAIVYDQLGGDSGKHYQYLYEKLFPIFLDETYAWTLILYGAFILVTCATVYVGVGSSATRIRRSGGFAPLVISHSNTLLLSIVSGAVSYLIVRPSLIEASQSGISGYVMTRLHNDSISLFTVHQVLNRFALFPVAIGIAVLASGDKARYIRGVHAAYALPAYLLTAVTLYGFCLSLGNKNELLFSLLSGALLYIVNSPRPRIVMPAVVGTVLLSAIAYIDFVRGIGLDSVWNELSFADCAGALIRIASSNESYGAHFSLYGCLAYDIPLTYGSSVVSFICSAIPRVLWPDRPPEIYRYYHEHVGAIDGQGYSIHHASGWYLNFGVTGILLGAVLLGWIWSRLYNNTYRVGLCRNRLSKIFCTISFITFSAGIPNLVRTGPDAYKGVIIDAIVIPLIALMYASRTSATSRYPAARPILRVIQDV